MAGTYPVVACGLCLCHGTRWAAVHERMGWAEEYLPRLVGLAAMQHLSAQVNLRARFG